MSYLGEPGNLQITCEPPPLLPRLMFAVGSASPDCWVPVEFAVRFRDLSLLVALAIATCRLLEILDYYYATILTATLHRT